jgi:hypothetical protein
MQTLKKQPEKSRPLVSLKDGIWEAKDLLKFLYVQRIKGFDVSASPHFDSTATTEWFTGMLRQSRMYLEYGSGGSTCLAAKLKKPFVTTDSDPYFLGCVKQRIIRDGFYDEATQNYRHADIGLIRRWGKPVTLTRPSKKRLALFAQYSDFPQGQFAGGVLPDLILVDGRFRVACALKAVRALKGRAGWTLAIDDYEGRSYAVVETFAKLERMVGRMAVFSGALPADDDSLAKAIAHYEYDPR